jgi:hypothetical protein
MMSRGVVGSVICRATMIAAISPIWLEWLVPGTLIARLGGLFWLCQIPLPQVASNLPFRRQQPSVYMCMGLGLREKLGSF